MGRQNVGGATELEAHFKGTPHVQIVPPSYSSSNLVLNLLQVAWAGKKWAGRPNWKRIFKKVAETHAGKTVGVFLCGPGAQELRDACKSNTTLGGATFDFHKENF